MEKNDPSLYTKLSEKMTKPAQNLLKQFLTTPLADMDLIARRHDVIDFLVANPAFTSYRWLHVIF